MKKMSRIAKGLDTFFKIILVLWMIGTVFGVLAIVLAMIVTAGDSGLIEDIGVSMMQRIQFGMATFELAPAYGFAAGVGQKYFWIMLVIGMLGVPIYYFMIRFIRNILKPIIAEEPFHATLAVHLKRLAWLVVGAGLVDELYEFISYQFTVRYVDLKTLFINDSITAITLNYTFNTDFIVFAIVLFLLSLVFKYGQELQQLSDETL